MSCHIVTAKQSLSAVALLKISVGKFLVRFWMVFWAHLCIFWSLLLMATWISYYLMDFSAGVLLVIWASRSASAVTVALREAPIRTPVWRPVCARYPRSNMSTYTDKYSGGFMITKLFLSPSSLSSVMPVGKCSRRKLWPLQTGILQSSTWQSPWLWKVLLYGCVQSVLRLHMDLSKCRQ